MQEMLAHLKSLEISLEENLVTEKVWELISGKSLGTGFTQIFGSKYQ